MPYSTGVLGKFELVYLGNNKIILLFPTTRSHGTVPEYVHYDKIIESFSDGKNWLYNLNMPYITDLNKNIGNGKIINFIKFTNKKLPSKNYFNICAAWRNT